MSREADAKAEDEDYFVPLQDQRVFGSGIKRKRVQFVPAKSSNTEDQAITSKKASTPFSAADRYMSIVFPQNDAESPASSKTDCISETTVLNQPLRRVCPVCKLPLEQPNDTAEGSHAASGIVLARAAHENSIAHQLCLNHVHPPSHVDRSRPGFRYLASYGWNPDSRRGLGLNGDGILAPVKAREKHDTVGLGTETEQAQRRERADKANPPRGRGKDFEHDAKQSKQKAEADRRRDETLRQMIWGDDRLEKYLGSSANLD